MQLVCLNLNGADNMPGLYVQCPCMGPCPKKDYLSSPAGIAGTAGSTDRPVMTRAQWRVSGIATQMSGADETEETNIGSRGGMGR